MFFLLHHVASSLQNNSAECSDGAVRLGMNVTSGRLDVCVNNAWGSVCSYGFSETAATVACAFLGGYSGECLCAKFNSVKRKMLAIEA